MNFSLPSKNKISIQLGKTASKSTTTASTSGSANKPSSTIPSTATPLFSNDDASDDEKPKQEVKKGSKQQLATASQSHLFNKIQQSKMDTGNAEQV